MKKYLGKTFGSEKGSLALEQVLFIGAIIAMSAGLFLFYGDISAYFSSFDVSNLPTQPPTP
jgi:hypothetical protein